MMRPPRRRPTLVERQSAFLQTFSLLRGEIAPELTMVTQGPIGGAQTRIVPDAGITAALITASAMLVIGADTTTMSNAASLRETDHE